MKKEYIECGRICSAHGVKGEIKVEHWCDSAKVLASQKCVFIKKRDGSYSEMSIKHASAADRFVIMSLDGVDGREAAQALRGVTLYLHRDSIPIPKGAMLIADMIGLPVYHFEDGRLLGEITAVDDTRAGRLYTVSTEHGDVLLPGVAEFVKEISEDGGMKVLPIPGLFDEEDEI